MNSQDMDADLRSVQQARDLAVGAREAMRAFQFAPQDEVDRICEAMVAAAMREAGRLGQMAHEETRSRTCRRAAFSGVTRRGRSSRSGPRLACCAR